MEIEANNGENQLEFDTDIPLIDVYKIVAIQYLKENFNVDIYSRGEVHRLNMVYFDETSSDYVARAVFNYTPWNANFIITNIDGSHISVDIESLPAGYTILKS